MDWSNERYVRVYVRETVGDVALTWQGRAIWKEILVKCDRAGVIALDGHGVRGLAGLIRMPADVVEEHLQQLLDDGRIELNGDYLVIPNYVDAQEATQSDKQRAAESRARRREKAMLGEILSQNVTDCHKTNSGVTACHDVSQDVTPCCAVPSRTVPNRAEGERAPAHDQNQKRYKKKRKTQIPAGWAPNNAHKELAAELHLDVDAEAEKFRDHAVATGRTLANWDAGYRNWLKKAVEYRQSRPRQPKRNGEALRAWERVLAAVQRNESIQMTDLERRALKAIGGWDHLRRSSNVSLEMTLFCKAFDGLAGSKMPTSYESDELKQSSEKHIPNTASPEEVRAHLKNVPGYRPRME